MELRVNHEPAPSAYRPFKINFSPEAFEDQPAATPGYELVLQTLLRLSHTASIPGMIGTSASMKTLFRTMLRLADSEEPVLILGETGTGKELVARAIHQSGNLSNRSFMPIDCGALSPALIETELFGYRRGAFTGATETRKGLFEAAQGGTIFLDEVGELPLELQSKLLRALQEHEIKQVGGTCWSKFKGRIIVATNRNLEAAVEQRTFRADLYYRLNVLTLTLPPLRKRKGDIPVLANYFLAKYSRGKGQCQELSAEALDRMEAHDWPGNVRELENCIRRLVACTPSPVIKDEDLPGNMKMGKIAIPVMEMNGEVVSLQEVERLAILRAIKQAYGDKVLAARLLGIGKTTLYRKLKSYACTARDLEGFGSSSLPSTSDESPQSSPEHCLTSVKRTEKGDAVLSLHS